ncbi:class I SAM-dependent methyltransferase [Tamlana crocina]|uniref:Class I SAM-dependent methyltransferase n=1 Tax=Tamlana crocina TaxID=393006 RepID=A0ABX1DBT5_9FLAO|nr:class I SAM-dependent methyltransferase [Tamlana crocina]NJX15820.1 class I SAM-dependent methyltransferase [Tamlana crocina]
MPKKVKTPWPTKAVMEQIYDMHLWGGTDFDFYSGCGSHDPEIVNLYLEAVTAFLKSFKEPLTVCDLGCGDFNIGQHLYQYTKQYIGIDIVESLIQRNKTLFRKNNLDFRCLDIAKDKLPQADCVMLRQVLQHLSNAEVLAITKKLANYKYIILTEHLPTGDFIPNKDIISGQGIRIKQNSGVDILKAPFNLKIKSEQHFGEHVFDNNKGRIVTKLYRVF